MSKFRGRRITRAIVLPQSVRLVFDPPAVATLRLPLGAYATLQHVAPGVVATVDYGVPRVATNPGGQACIVQVVTWFDAYAVPLVKIEVVRLVGLPFVG